MLIKNSSSVLDIDMNKNAMSQKGFQKIYVYLYFNDNYVQMDDKLPSLQKESTKGINKLKDARPGIYFDETTISNILEKITN